MSYRDHLEAQKKYIETKKEARRLKEERFRNPRPPKLDPPPAPTSKLVLAGLVSLIALPLIIMVLMVSQVQPTSMEREGLLIWIMGTEDEYNQIKNWLEPEILASNLTWEIQQLTSRQDLTEQLALGLTADVILVDQNLASEIHSNQALVPLWSKGNTNSFEDCFWPILEAKPFQKSLGLAIPNSKNVEEARHLTTILRQFAPLFLP